MPPRAGFIGLGIMGKPIARQMVEKGLETTVCDIAEEPVAELAALGAKRAATPRELADAADVIGICVRNDTDVNQVCHGADGFFAGEGRGQVLAIHSTVSTETVRQVGTAALEHGMRVLDAPVTGGPMAAEAGTLTYMIGGDDDAVAACRAVFETSAKTIVHTGPLGTATYTKICNNLLQYIQFSGIFEAFGLLQRLGVSKEVLEAVTKSNGLLNESGATYMNGVVAGSDAMINDAGLQAYLQGRLDIADKDLALALQEATRVGFAIPTTALVSQTMARIYRVNDSSKR